MNLTVYCDEAGNSGSNLLDKDQPIYVIGAWAVGPEHYSDAVEVVSALATELGAPTKELKSTRLLRRSKGQEAFAPFLRAMGAAGAFPIYAIFHKRYWIAGKVVEKLLDPMWNPRSSWELFADLDYKKELANVIAEWPDSYLASFAQVLRAPDQAELRECIESLQRISRLLGLENLDAMLLGALENLDEIFDREFRLDTQDRKDLEPVNVSSLAAFLQVIETIGRNVPGSEVRVVHDSAGEFTRGYDYVVNHQENLPEWRLRNGKPLVKKLQSVSSFTMEDSAGEPLIQASDVLAGGIFQIARAAAKGDLLPKWLLQALAPILISATFQTPAGFVMGSDKFLGALFGPVGEELTKSRF